jgi:thiol-disulfide isomerase/thioredoxin
MAASGRIAAVVLALAIVLVGCAGSSGSSAGTTAPTAASLDASAEPGAGETTTRSAGSSDQSVSAPPASAPGVVMDQAWATDELVDVSTGETFRIADHAGTVIIIETMAIWCPNCRRQQGDVKAALQSLPPGAVTYIVLDVDPSEDRSSLAAYREQNGFPGRYAVAGTAVARALAAEFGDQILNPPSTPIVVVGSDGRVTLTEFGHKSPDELVALAKAHGA